ncbi:MAG: TonB-dependent receptor, partial [Betaproteobacteria bacterium]|nr:TonB-dependent receptor [Betaproteobacteria bacterium]
MKSAFNGNGRTKAPGAAGMVDEPGLSTVPGSFHRLKLFVVMAAVWSTLPPTSFAQNKAEVLELETIEVVGTTPLPGIGVPLNQVPANVQAASGKSIAEQRPVNISEFLDSNLGSVTINDTVSNPYQPDVQYRGFTASPLLGTPQGLSVFLDGVRVNEPFGDIVNWDLIPSNAIANINLIPGSNPLFGLNTLGGALSVHTKSGSGNPGASATVTGGSWGRRAFEFEAGGKKDQFDYFVAGNIFHEDGWRMASESDIRQLFTKAGWQDEKSNLDLSLLLADNKMHGIQALPQEQMGNREKAYSIPDSIENKLAMITLNGSRFIADDKLLAGNLYYRHNRADGFNSNVNDDYPGDGVVSSSTSVACLGVVAPSVCDPYAANVVTRTDTDGYGGAVQMTLMGDLAGHKNQFTAGVSADIGRTDFRSDTQIANVIGIETVSSQPITTPQTVRLKADNDYYGLYATDTFSLTDQLHVTLSGRYNRANVKLSGTSLDLTDDTLVPGDLDGNHRFSRFNPALGINFNPSKSLGLYGGYSEGMRAPTPVELACADPDHPCALPNAFAGDPPLKMVVSRTWEGGARGRLGESINWNAGLFHTENTDDILFIASSTSGAGYFQNVGKTRRQGVELGMNGTLDKFSFAANYSYVDATFQTPFTASSAGNSSSDADDNIHVGKGSTIPGVPRQMLKLRLGFEITPAWSVGSNVVATSSQYARGDENNKDEHGKIPGYTVVNLDTRYSIGRNWKVFAKVTNVFDRNYETFGLLGPNLFTGPGNSYSSNPADWIEQDQFRTPGAPRAG